MGMARVLVADDDRTFVRTVIAGVGEFVNLRIVTSGSALLQVQRCWEPHVVVFDLLLPDIDGFAMLERLLCPSAGQRPAVLCVTGGRGANTRPPYVGTWPVGTLTRSASPGQIRASVLRAVAARQVPLTLPH